MKNFFLFVMVFLFCSGFLGIDRWYEKYGITSKEIDSVEAVPKLITAMTSGDIRDAIKAGKEIGKFGNKASLYFPDIVKVASSDFAAKSGHVFIAAMNAATAVYDGNDEKSFERLLYLGLSYPHQTVRTQTCRNVYILKVYSPRIVESLESLIRSESNPNIKQSYVNTLNVINFNLAKSDTGNKNITTVAHKINSSYVLVEQNPYAIAVIIGNMDYISSKKLVPNVDYAVNDARAIKDILVNLKGYREGNIIYIENATQADMISTLGNKDNHQGKLYNWVRPESDVFVYYSGHGAPSLKDGSGYLLPVDADPSTVELNGYSLDTLYQNIAKLPAKSITLVIDACFSGSSQGGTITKNASSITLKPITIPKLQNGINVLSATNVGEVASWDTEAQHSLFTNYFLKALSGAADKKPYGNEDHKVDLAEVQKYVNLEVTYMARRNYGRDQNPQISGNSAFVFSSLKE